MLEELRIRGLGVIEDAVLPLGAGLTVVTGETGAGKTMVVSGLLLLFGGRGDPGRVRTGSEQAVIDGRLAVAPNSAAADRVRDAGGALDDDTDLVLRRTVSAAGRSRAFVGGAPTPIAVLGELSERLLVVHGQSDQLRLIRPAEQRAALDRYTGIDTGDCAVAFHNWRDAVAALTERTVRMAELRREADLLAYGLTEIETAAPRPNEDVELADAASRLAHADGLRLAAAAAHDALLGAADDPGGDGADVVSRLGAARRVLAQQDGADRDLDELTGRITELIDLAADLGAEFGSYTASLDADPARLASVEARRAELAALIRKYGDDGLAHGSADLVSVQSWAAQAARRLSDIDVSDEAIAALQARVAQTATVLADLAEQLRIRRTHAAAELAAAVTDELAGLAMPHAAFTVTVRPRAVTTAAPSLSVHGSTSGIGPDGADDVELLLQAHPEAPPLPLGRGASGGELSRVMLALEVCLAGTDPIPTMVFDEVDAGVGGRAATEVGRRLARLSENHQVIVVTHLAQVAAFADRHIVVDKHQLPARADGSQRTGESDTGESDTREPAMSADTGFTASDVRVVSGADQLNELARMLGGSASDTARQHAAELLGVAADRTATRPTRATARARKAVKTRS